MEISALEEVVTTPSPQAGQVSFLMRSAPLLARGNRYRVYRKRDGIPGDVEES